MEGVQGACSVKAATLKARFFVGFEAMVARFGG